MPGAPDKPYIQVIQDCEAAIVRVRSAIRSGDERSEQVGEDVLFILGAIEKKLAGFARRAAALGPASFEEALEAMQDRLIDDIWSLTYVSIETQLGAYLNHMPLRVLWNVARKYGRASASFVIERLDAPAGAAGPPLHTTIADSASAAAFEALHDRAALEAALGALPPDERLVVRLRSAGVENNVIAQQLGVSPATATRIYQRALAGLRLLLHQPEE